MTKTEILKAIRAKCLDCCGSPKEVSLCTVKGCALFQLKIGKDPNPRRLSEEAKARVIENLRKGREAKNRTPGSTVKKEEK